ncbi:MAG TPA: single-stranded DNA-binding protein [Quisquiliibacterium sp.]|nr:single-stranded DNA-binding protein [Quisquiliibacterium sp.]
MSATRPPRPAAPTDDATGTPTAQALLAAARALSDTCHHLRFTPPVTHVYNPLDYAWDAYETYVRRFGAGPRRVVFLGMNPGPFGMMQIGVPFGEVAAVRDWMGIRATIARPAHEHPKRPIQGFDCTRSEVSGRRLWGWAAQRFGRAEDFFAQSFVLNYCPLVFLEASGRNFTPDRLPAAEKRPLEDACDRHLRAAIDALQPEWAIGIGGFAAQRLQAVLGPRAVTGAGAADDARGARDARAARVSPPAIRIAQILHPSPASPAANRGWAEAVDRSLEDLGVFGPVRPA